MSDGLLDDLNIYYEKMSEIILCHNGYIDSFIGDAIFAIFGISNDNHAIDACMAAIACQKSLIDINKKIVSMEPFELVLQRYIGGRPFFPSL